MPRRDFWAESLPRPRTPFFFKFAFAVILSGVLAVFGCVGFVFYKVITLGPEGVGRMVGAFLRGAGLTP